MIITRYRQKLASVFSALSVTAALLICSTGSAFAYAETKHAQHKLVGSHGMVLVYDQDEGLFASHLPLYRSPHHYQIIYKVEVTEQESIKQLLTKGMVTLLPENFDLNKLINGEAFSVPAQFFQGHFERGGKLTSTGKINFISPVLVKKVSKEHSQSASFYTAVISKNKAIIAHKIQHPPSFDALAFMPLTDKTTINKPIICDPPKAFDITSIKQQLAKCGIPEPVYIETQDFAL
ncbi:hypothetical protein SG34_029610 [Thalassomonas viridans]|uniref:Uncharacterized protein n=1 Tax=Thalassomonas viridans TaxID=137584 RepID=A0AAE9Z9B0_9GAMM|nr:hypothetical protein [Thalassomonas viridans]WDE08898.1 hypothetical protein SG34_033975 [Thalassomonas viridans]WDE08945.1 hypothetical protein SG34_029610 [Thalassomonas viridans]